MSSEKIHDKPDLGDELFTSMLEDDVVPLRNKGAHRIKATQKQTPGMAERRKCCTA